MTIYQTQGGIYNSTPRPEDVRAYLAGETAWEQSYADAGHGEYIDNVCAVAVECERTGETPEAVLCRINVEYR